MKDGADIDIVMNGQQRRIVRSTASVKQVIAAAGAAKTTTLVGNAAKLIKDGVDPRDILFLTFSKPATAVLRARLPADVRCRTTHSLGLSLLARAGLVAGVTRSTEPLSVKGQLKRLRQALKVEADRWDDINPTSAKFLREARRDAKKTRQLLTFIKWVRARGSVGALDAKETGSPFRDFAKHLASLKDVARRFAKLKAEAGEIDYADMIRLGRKAVERGISLGFAHVFVDEYQDCNPAHARLLVALAPKLKSLTVVGDPLQSIFGFAGAGFTDLSTLTKEVKTYPLTTSFRLNNYTAALATALGQLVRPDMPPIHGDRIGGHRPRLIECPDRAAHDQAVLDTVKHLINTGTPPHRIAVLGRVKAQVREVEALLLSAQIETDPLYRTRKPDHIEAVLKLIEHISGCEGKTGRERLRQQVKKLAGDRDMPESTIEDNVRRLLLVTRSKAFESQYKVCAAAYISAKGEGLSKDAIADINRWIAPSRRQKDAAGMRRAISKLASQDKVVTSHLHQTKGYEWDYVLILHAVEGSWPFFKATTKAAKDEELHALYVAVTRAREGLYLFEGTYKNARARKSFSDPSSFLAQRGVRNALKIVDSADAAAWFPR